ncbi:MAG: TrkH family potassium uptake protein [Thainema sp.]
MNPFIKTLCHDLGLLLHIPGIMALLSLPVSIISQEYFAIAPFILTTLVSVFLGQLLYRLGKGAEAAQLQQSMITVALSWGIIPWIGAIPFVAIAYNLASQPEVPPTVLYFQNFWSALFEGFSGFTSAGLTMTIRPSQLPHSLQWWRSFMQWVGGVGVIVLMISILSPSTDAYKLYSAEGRSDRIGLTLGRTVRRIWTIYAVLTVFSILLFRLVGMPWWEALNHAMCAIATGGFSITDNSMGSYDTPIQIAVMVVMILGAISFSTHYAWLIQRRLSTLWRDPQHRSLWILLVIGTGVLLLESYGFSGTWRVVDVGFQWVSALTTCGYSTEMIQFWSPTSKLMLSTAMIIGGAAGSTVGGIKLNRLNTLMKAVVWRFRRISLKAHEMPRYQIGEQVVPEKIAYRWIESAAVLLLLWLGAIAFGVLLLIHRVPNEYNLSDVFFEASSALGSAGLSTGITGPRASWDVKAILMALMWMGRLEIIPVLLLLTKPFQEIVQAIKK